MTAVAESEPPGGATGTRAATLEECRKPRGVLIAESGPDAGALGARRRRVDRAAVTAVLLVASAMAAGKVAVVAGGWLAAAALAAVVVLAGAEAVLAWRRTAEGLTALGAALIVGMAAAAPWLVNMHWLMPTGDPCQRAVIQVCDQGPPLWWSQ